MWNSFINNQSVKVRFLTTLFVNIVKVGLGFVAGIIVARGLGPAGYGNFNFLLGSFVSIITLLDMGTSSAFYTFLSQRKRSSKFYLYYFLWLIIQFILVLLFIALIFPESWRNTIWLGQTKGLIMLAFLASFMMTKVWQTVIQAGESIRATVGVQLRNVILSGLYLCIVLVMVFLHSMTIPNLFIVIAFIYFLFAFVLARRLKDNLIATEEAKLSNIINEFKTYCTPLVIYGVVSFVYSFADIWLLQRFAGAIQQGFYFVGYKFGAICLIATTSMSRIFWKEIVEANELGNKERLYYLYRKTSRGLYFVSAIGACFLIPFGREILVFLLGPEYEAGWLCLAIMFLYPIHQSLGQINGSYFYATAHTKLYSKLGITMMMIGIPVTYFVLASHSALIPGLELGSVGLALKMVILQIAGVNVFTYFICKLSGWKFDILYQFVTIGLLLCVSFAIKSFLGWIFHISNVHFYPIALMALCMPFYILMTGLIIYLFPGLAGTRRKEILGLIRVFKERKL